MTLISVNFKRKTQATLEYIRLNHIKMEFHDD